MSLFFVHILCVCIRIFVFHTYKGLLILPSGLYFDSYISITLRIYKWYYGTFVVVVFVLDMYIDIYSKVFQNGFSSVLL